MRESMAPLAFDLLTCERNNSLVLKPAVGHNLLQKPQETNTVSFPLRPFQLEARIFFLGILYWLFYICPHYTLHFYGPFPEIMKSMNGITQFPCSLATTCVVWWETQQAIWEGKRKMMGYLFLLWWSFGYSCHLYNVAFVNWPFMSRCSSQLGCSNIVSFFWLSKPIMVTVACPRSFNIACRCP